MRFGAMRPSLVTGMVRWLGSEDAQGVLAVEERKAPEGWEAELRLRVFAENVAGAVCIAALAVRRSMMESGTSADRVALSSREG